MTYVDLIETVAQREMGILGKPKTLEIFHSAGLELDNDGKLKVQNNLELEDLDRLMNLLNETYGAVAVMGCKITVKRMAREGGLKLPGILL